MKKGCAVISIISVLLIVLSGFVALNYTYLEAKYFEIKYKGWQTVSMENVGTLKLPAEWVFTQVENIFYFTDAPLDEDYNLLMIGTPFYKSGEGNVSLYAVAGVDYVSALNLPTAFSNHVSYSKIKVEIAGEKVSRFTGRLTGSGPVTFADFLVFDASVNERLFVKILKSFEIASYTGYTP